MSLVAAGLSSDANLQGYWKLDGNFNDSSPNSYTLTNSGATSVSGLFDGGYDFELADPDYATIADASCANLEISGSQSWVIWVKQETITSYQDPMVKAKADGSIIHGLTTSADANSFVYFTLTGLTTNSQVAGGTGTVGQWHHIAGVYDSSAGKLRVYLDGVKVGEVTAGGTATDTDGDFSLGRNGSAGNTYFDGVLDEAAVFNRALTDAEILSIFKAGRGTRTAWFM